MVQPKIIPWNKNRCVGQRQAFTQIQVQQLDSMLLEKNQYRNHALFRLAIDSMLRCGDLLALRVADIQDPSGKIKSVLTLKQQKTQYGVYPALSSQTQRVCEQWISISQKMGHDFLFTSSRTDHKKPLFHSSLRWLVKQWAVWLELSPGSYSAHSLRRTKPRYLYQCGVPIEEIALMLGHSSPAITLIYLGIDRLKVQATSLEFDIFGRSKRKKKISQSIELSHKQLEKLADMVAERIVQHGKDKSL